MTHLILIEPADEHRRGFARWCLEQDPRIEVASASGSEVPADLFAAIPEELLDGAYIDGGLYRATPVPESAPAAPAKDGSGRQAKAAPAKRTQRKGGAE